MDLSSQGTQKTPSRGTDVPLGSVYVNDKWQGSELLRKLRSLRRVLFDEEMGVVDFRPGKQFAVVYVTEGDLAAGNHYRRKLVKLRKAVNVRGVVMVERTPVSGQYFSALQHFAVLELGLILLPIATQEEASSLLASLGEATCPAELRRPPAEDKDMALLTTLQRIPKLGQTKARALLDRFGSLYTISQASVEDLSEVVGKSIAQSVWTFLQQPA